MPPVRTHTFQAPKGTRDFYPPDMAIRRYVESVWRRVSIGHGFEEIDGPTFEHLELYTVKSGPGIVSELFSFRRAGGDADYALRPEFTPTLARMVAARGPQLPKPIKWFCLPNHFRAERPQRGRLREFGQWNVDMLGDASPFADAEVIAVAAGAMERFGLGPDRVRVRLSHRGAISRLLLRLGLDDDRLPAAFALLDRRDKLPPEAFGRQAAELGLDADRIARFDAIASATVPLAGGWPAAAAALAGGLEQPAADEDLADLHAVCSALEAMGLAPWCDISLGIVRGLAYYTGAVFELHETTGRERAVAGGGRYDELVEMFGGPPTPAVGFAMGDVVLRLVLEDQEKLAPADQYLPRVDVFVINARDEDAAPHEWPLVMRLRRDGWHVRRSYRATRNVGKLLGEAGRCRARLAVILGRELDGGDVVVKDLESGEQTPLPMEEIGAAVEARLAGRT